MSVDILSLAQVGNNAAEVNTSHDRGDGNKGMKACPSAEITLFRFVRYISDHCPAHITLRGDMITTATSEHPHAFDCVAVRYLEHISRTLQAFSHRT